MSRASAVLAGCFLLAVGLAGCATQKIPEDALRLPESSLEVRSVQSRRFAAESETDILVASVGVLQDMEFNIDEVEKSLGVLSASKVADADSKMEQAGLLMLEVVCTVGGTSCGALDSASDEQKIFVTLVVLPTLASDDDFVARITIQRLVFDKQERIKLREQIDDPETYQEIFAQLGKSIALRAAE